MHLKSQKLKLIVSSKRIYLYKTKQKKRCFKIKPENKFKMQQVKNSI